MALRSGHRIGRYELVAPLGSGATSEVWSAVQRGPAALDRRVALKLLRAGTGNPETPVREARLGALVAHPNVVATLDFGEQDGRWYVAMELVDGVTVAHLAERGPVPAAALVHLGRQVCAGLQAIHDLGQASLQDWGEGSDAEDTWVDEERTEADGVPTVVVHRDIKPQNLLLDRQGRVRVADLGLARALGTAGQRGGTRGFMPPEQYLGFEDARADVFALGATLALLAAGRPALPPATEVDALIDRIREWDPTPFDRVVPGLARVLSRCLRVDPDERWASVHELAGALAGLRPDPGPSLRQLAVRVLQPPAPPEEPPPPARILPEPDTPFVGRRALLAEVRRQLEGGERCQRLVGAPGMGSSRLALEAVRTARATDGGSRWVDLQGTRAPGEVLARVARTLELGDNHASEARIGRVLAAMGPSVLVLDDCDERHADLVAAWLRAAPALQIVTTGLHALDVPEERVIEVGPLHLADATRLLEHTSGLQLSADDPEVTGLVDRLGGMPLALELAGAQAARTGQLPAGRIAGLEAVVEQTRALLDAEEQSALVQLSVFEGSFTLAAAEAVLRVDGGWALDCLDGLVRARVLTRDPTRADRLRLPPLIAEPLRERLSEAERGAAFARHARYYAQLAAEALGDALRGHRSDAADLPNLRAACRRSLAAGWGSLAARTAIAVVGRARYGGPGEQARQLGLRVLDEGQLDDRDRARLLRLLADVERDLGHPDDALAHLEQALTVASRAGDPALEAEVQLGLGNRLVVLGRFDEARPHLQAVERLAPADPWMRSRTLSSLGTIERNIGALDAAHLHLEEALVLARQTGDRRQEGLCLSVIANVHRELGELDEARTLTLEALRCYQEVGDRDGAAVTHASLAGIARERGELDEARSRYQAALDQLRRLGSRAWDAALLHNLGYLEHSAGHDERALALLDEAEAVATELGQATMEGIILSTRGMVLVDGGSPARARPHLERAIEVLEPLAQRRWLAGAHGVMGLAATLGGRHEEAERLFEAAAVELARVGAPPQMLAQLLAHRGRAEVARGEIAAARATLAELEAMAADHGCRPDSPMDEAVGRLRDAIAAVR